MNNFSFKPIQTIPINTANLQTKRSRQIEGNSFSNHLHEAMKTNKSLTISKHAKERLQQREIHISDNRWEQIEQKIIEAKKLGVNDSLVLLKDAALIVSAKNNTVITAMNRHEATSQIFTNINGTIVLES